MMSRKVLPIALELMGITAIGAGIGVEVAAHADAGWVLVTGGSCLIAAGSIIWGKFMRKEGQD
jgi:hypothetical protein